MIFIFFQTGEIDPVTENVPEDTEIIKNKNLITAEDPDTTANLTFDINWDKSWATKQGVKVDPEFYKGYIKIMGSLKILQLMATKKSM